MAPNENFPMHRAAEEGDLEQLKHLIGLGANVDCRDILGRTPLHRAAEGGSYEAVEFLVLNKCDINAKDKADYSPMLHAALFCQKDIVDLLLKLGAQVDCTPDSNMTLLHWVSFRGWADVVQRIIEDGKTDVNVICPQTPLMQAARKGHEEVAVVLVRARADINRRSFMKKTALHFASEKGRLEVVRILLEIEGLELDAQDSEGETPLHAACRFEKMEVVKKLLAAGATTNLKNRYNKTALSILVEKNINLEVIRLFILQGAFFEHGDFVQLSLSPDLKEQVLKDVYLCTQSIVNQFNNQSLPAVYRNPCFAKKLPKNIDSLKLSARKIHEIENFVRAEIQAKTFFNVVEARPTLLTLMCVQTLLGHQSTTESSDLVK